MSARMRALTPMCELGVSGSGVGESGSVGRVSSRARVRVLRGAVGGVVKKRFSQVKETPPNPSNKKTHEREALLHYCGAFGGRVHRVATWEPGVR